MEVLSIHRVWPTTGNLEAHISISCGRKREENPLRVTNAIFIQVQPLYRFRISPVLQYFDLLGTEQTWTGGLHESVRSVIPKYLRFQVGLTKGRFSCGPSCKFPDWTARKSSIWSCLHWWFRLLFYECFPNISYMLVNHIDASSWLFRLLQTVLVSTTRRLPLWVFELSMKSKG